MKKLFLMLIVCFSLMSCSWLDRSWGEYRADYCKDVYFFHQGYGDYNTIAYNYDGRFIRSGSNTSVKPIFRVVETNNGIYIKQYTEGARESAVVYTFDGTYVRNVKGDIVYIYDGHYLKYASGTNKVVAYSIVKGY